MAQIQLSHLGVDIPVLNAKNRSLKNRLLRVSGTGRLDVDRNRQVIARVLKDLNLVLSDGDRLGLIGPNGSGKSSLLRVLSGVYPPTKGHMFSVGRVVSLIDVGFGIDPELTGRENIFLRGALLGLNNGEIKGKLDEIIDFAELGDFIDMPVRIYSSGMHMRLAFSVSTIIRPEILLMDEWLSVGDDAFRRKAEARLMDLTLSTKILVIASHSRQLIESTCDRVIWLDQGSIKMDGYPSEVCEAYFGP